MNGQTWVVNALIVCVWDRVSLDLAYQDLQVYPVCQELKAWLDQRETLDFRAALVYLDDLVLMVLQVLKVLNSSETRSDSIFFLVSENISTFRATSESHHKNIGQVKKKNMLILVP